jgi:hypothetical protein
MALARDCYLKGTLDDSPQSLLAQTRPANSTPLASANAVLPWNNAAMRAAYDERAVGTHWGALRRPASERRLSNKEQPISYAAYRALVHVLPVDTNSVYVLLMKQFGYDPSDDSTDIEPPTGIGNVACAAVLEFRQHDKSDQLGDLAQGAYSDWTGYPAVNTPSPVPARAGPDVSDGKAMGLAESRFARKC